MARGFRIYGEKKRGARRTGSGFLGSLGEAFFFSALVALGVLSLAAMITWQFVDPAPEITWGRGFWSMVLVLSSFILIGGGGVIRTLLHVGASAERRSALAKRAAGIELIGDALAGRSDFPNIPNAHNMTNSPGVTLAYRLPVIDMPAWKLSAGALLCATWLVAAVALIVVFINRYQARPEWFLIAFATPFLAVGGWAFRFFVRQLWIQAAVGPTSVEISDLPLYPGEPYDASLAQAGRLHFNSLELWLVCTEEATYQQGTDVRTETRDVYRQQLSRTTDFKIDPARPFESRCRIAIPEGSMHSFQSNHNAIAWKLKVIGRAKSVPPFERTFPIIVHPAHVKEPPT